MLILKYIKYRPETMNQAVCQYPGDGISNFAKATALERTSGRSSSLDSPHPKEIWEFVTIFRDRTYVSFADRFRFVASVKYRRYMWINYLGICLVEGVGWAQASPNPVKISSGETPHHGS